MTSRAASRRVEAIAPSDPMTTSEKKIQEPLRAALGRLGRLVPTFERRPGQLEMARLWDETLERGGVLAVEAPTGVGKSLAYLLPALLLRYRGSGPVVVSTHTKALQDQLLTRDVPLAIAAVGAPLRVATLKGRASYLCRRYDLLVVCVSNAVCNVIAQRRIEQENIL